MNAHIPHDPDFDAPPSGLMGTPPRVAFVFGVVSGIGLVAIVILVTLIR